MMEEDDNEEEYYNEPVIGFRRSRRRTNWRFRYDGLSQLDNVVLSDLNHVICSITSNIMEVLILLAVFLLVLAIVHRYQENNQLTIYSWVNAESDYRISA